MAEHVPLIRTRGGLVVHRYDCRRLEHSRSSSPWLWAKGRTLEEIRHSMGMTGSHACKICRPLEER